MGVIKLFSSGKTSYDYERLKVSDKDPNPSNFKILTSVQMGQNSAIRINYPNCTNYEGNKIIVYKKTSVKDLRFASEIDPHFIECGKFKPFARFEPTRDGWDEAMKLLLSWMDNTNKI